MFFFLTFFFRRATPTLFSKNNKKTSQGCWVEYAAGKVHRVGKVTDILSADETAHAPKVVYSVTTDKGTHEYTNNPR